MKELGEDDYDFTVVDWWWVRKQTVLLLEHGDAYGLMQFR
jgi:hypothetical protein